MQHESIGRVALLLALIGGCAAESTTTGTSESTTHGPYADAVVSFVPGEGAGFGADKMPQIVLGPPHGKGDGAGGLHVVSLGKGGQITLRFEHHRIVDGPGADFIVFENAFAGWPETAQVFAADAIEPTDADWRPFPCDPHNAKGGFPGCAGVSPVYSAPDNGIAATDVAKAGGDAFDLADVGLTSARALRIVDSGLNEYEGGTGGFDLDAVAVVNGEALP